MIKYIQDSNVDEKLNKKIIELLSICFTKEPVLQHRRYCKEMPQHRWYIEDEKKLIAHLALHEKKITTEKGAFPIGGVAEVCVHPDHRGNGYVKQMLLEAHQWLKENKYPFALLFGEREIYSSSGYSAVKNEIRYFDDKVEEWVQEINPHAMKNVLGNISWPQGLININGPTF